MRALQIAHPGDDVHMAVVDVHPPSPGAGQVLIKVTYAGLNFTDVLAARGVPGYAASYPFIPGMEVTGTVIEVGAGVTSVRRGGSVVAFIPKGGGLAELALADAALVLPVPPGMPAPAATAVPLTWATAWGLVQRAHVSAQDAVLVTSAAGGVGAALCALLVRQGVRCLVAGTSTAAKAASVYPGAHAVVRDEEFLAKAAAAISPVGDDPDQDPGGVAVGPRGAGFDVILESLGGPVLSAALDHLARGGRLVSYGVAAGAEDPLLPAMGALRAGNLTVSGFSILGTARQAPQAAATLMGEVMTVASDDIARTSPAITTWDGVVQAHLDQAQGRSSGKTVLRMHGPS